MKQFLLKFTLIGIVSFGLVYSPWVYEHLVGEFTRWIAALAGWLLQSFGAQVTVHANVLRIPGFAVEIRSVCNGLEATLVLWAALLAFPARWKYKFMGLLIGTLAVQALNILRIISLLYLGALNRTWFEFAHAYLWEILIMLDILILFLIWLRFLPSPTDHEAAR